MVFKMNKNQTYRKLVHYLCKTEIDHYYSVSD